MFDLNKITDKDKQILTEILNYQNMFKLKVIDIKQLNDIRILHTEFNGFLLKSEDPTDDILLTSFDCLIPKIKEWSYHNGYSLISWKEKQSQYVVDIRKNGTGIIKSVSETTELKALFLAVEYIIETLKKETNNE